MIEKRVEPGRQGRIMTETRLLHLARLRARTRELVGRGGEPSANVGRPHLRMELQSVGRIAVAKSLVRKGVAAGQQFAPPRHLEAFLMPMVDMQVGRKERLPGRRRTQRKITDLVDALRMARHARTERAGKQLPAEANAE